MLSDANWAGPVRWNREAERAGKPALVFCASMADVFEDHPQLPEPRARLWDLIEHTPWLTWQLLTKRIENVAGMAPWGRSWPANVWIGTSVENQRYAAERVPHLLALSCRVRFLSCEPLLGAVDVNHWLGYSVWPDTTGPRGGIGGQGVTYWPGIDWLITGGESGPKARPSHPGWFRSLRDQCTVNGIPFFFKQWGEWAPHSPGPRGAEKHLVPGDPRLTWISLGGQAHPFTLALPERPAPVYALMERSGKKAAGAVLDGRTWRQIPPAAAEPRAKGQGALDLGTSP